MDIILNIALNIFKVLVFLFFGLMLYLAITMLLIGVVFVIREALLFYCGVDLYEKMKNILPKPKQKIKKKVVLNEESDKEWLKNRGRY